MLAARARGAHFRYAPAAHAVQSISEGLSVTSLLLAGDVGGTKTLLALVASEGSARRILVEETFRSRQYGALEEIVAEFLRAAGGRPHLASFSVAGIARADGASLPNLPWDVDGVSLRHHFSLESVRFINDVQATALAIPHLSSGELLTLQLGQPAAAGPRAVIAPGTGLGEAYLLAVGSGFRAFPSEGGNADFAPVDRLQAELLATLLAHVEHVSYEDLCSGRGLPRLYAALAAMGAGEEQLHQAELIAAAEDPAPIIVASGMAPGSEGSLAALTLRVFATILAAEAGNLALRILATGGVFVGGGIPPRILPLLRSEWFIEAFRRKGAFAGFLASIPLHVILEPRSALLGAVHFGSSS